MKVLRLHHPSNAFAVNLSAYINSLLPALKCRMNVQTTDRRSMLLCYVTNYVMKWKDAYSNKSLYSMHLMSYMAVYNHLREMMPCKPEMQVHLTARKIAWMNCTHKKFVPPKYSQANEHVNWRCPTSQNDLSMMEWLRTMDTWKPTTVPYTLEKKSIFQIGKSLENMQYDNSNLGISLVNEINTNNFPIIFRKCESREVFGLPTLRCHWYLIGVFDWNIPCKSFQCWNTMVRHWSIKP